MSRTFFSASACSKKYILTPNKNKQSPPPPQINRCSLMEYDYYKWACVLYEHLNLPCFRSRSTVARKQYNCILFVVQYHACIY